VRGLAESGAASLGILKILDRGVHRAAFSAGLMLSELSLLDNRKWGATVALRRTSVDPPSLNVEESTKSRVYFFRGYTWAQSWFITLSFQGFRDSHLLLAEEDCLRGYC